MPARPSARPPSPEPAPPSAALDAFRRALYPILRARDAAAFRRLLAESEDLLGDTGEATDWPEARVRALMADLLREPARFGLPRWPAPGADRESASTAIGDATPAATATLPTLDDDETAGAGSNLALPNAPERARIGSDPPLAHAAPAHGTAGPEPTVRAAPGVDGPAAGVDEPTPSAAADADPPAVDPSAPAAAGEPSEAAETPPEAPPKPRAGRRSARRAPPQQLSLW